MVLVFIFKVFPPDILYLLYEYPLKYFFILLVTNKRIKIHYRLLCFQRN